jgi:regulator of replication initiation timing
MASLENRVVQLEHLIKQKDTEINKLKKEIEALVDSNKELTAKFAEKAPTPVVQPRYERKAPTKLCPICSQRVYPVQFKNHAVQCRPDAPSKVGVPANG